MLEEKHGAARFEHAPCLVEEPFLRITFDLVAAETQDDAGEQAPVALERGACPSILLS